MTTSEDHPLDVGYRRSYRSLAAAIAVYLGGYLLTPSLSGQLGFLVTGLSGQSDLVVSFVLQAIFAAAVVVGGFLLVPAPIGLRLIAIAVVVVAIVVTIASQAARISGPMGAATVPMSLTVSNGYFMAALAVGGGWLLVRQARLGWLALLLVAVLVPLPFALTYANLGAGVVQLVSLGLSGAVLAAIVIAGRPLSDHPDLDNQVIDG